MGIHHRPPQAIVPAGRLSGAELIVLSCALLVMLAGFLYTLQQVRQDVARDVDRRARLAGSYLESRLQTAEALAERFRERYAGAAGATAPRLAIARDARQWRLPSRPLAAGVHADAGGAAPLTGLQSRELAAVLALEGRAAAQLAREPALSRLSYLSAGQFRYVLARAPAGDVVFARTLYAQPAWTGSLPARNPAAAAVISGAAPGVDGKGHVFTVAAPVQVQKQFLGALLLELRPDVLHAVLAGAAPGDRLLVDSRGQALARTGTLGGDGPVPLPPPGERQWRDDDGAEWWARPLAGGRAFLLQRLGTPSLLGAAAWRSLPLGLCVVLLAALAILVLRLRQSIGQLAQSIRRDALTGALNRRGLYEDAEVIRALARRQHRPLAVVLFDIDLFRNVNELHGHERGDKVLAALAHGLHHQVRDYDVVCRWSGEEFLVVLMLEGEADALPVAERLRNVAANACLREALTLITISAGMALWQDGEALDAAAARADQCMRAAKEAGRDRLEVAAEVVAAEP